MVKKNLFPTDIHALRKCDLSQWSEDFFWPISYIELMGIEDAIKRGINAYSESLPQFQQDMVIVCYKLFFEYLGYVHSRIVLNGLHERGREPLCSEMSRSIKGLVEQGAPLRPVVSCDVPRANKGCLSFVRKCKRSFEFSKDLPRSMWGNASVGIYEPSLNALSRSHLKRNRGRPVKIITEELWQDFDPVFGDESPEILIVADGLVEVLRKESVLAGVLNENDWQYLRTVTTRLLHVGLRGWKYLEHVFVGQGLEELYVGSCGNLYTRLLAIFCKRNGVRVFGYQHGECIPHNFDKQLWLELACVTDFFTYTFCGAKHLSGKVSRESFFCLDPTVNVIGAEGGFARCRNVELESGRLAKRRVMVVPNTFNYDNCVGQRILLQPLVQMDFEIRLVRMLHQMDLEVLYKRHPDGCLKGDLFSFHNEYVTIVEKPFDECLDMAEVFLFYHSCTTAINNALCTSKHIVYIDGGWEQWIPEVRKDFAERCEIVPASFDDRNRLVVDSVALKKAVYAKTKADNTTFIEKYLGVK